MANLVIMHMEDQGELQATAPHQAELASSTAPVKKENRNRHHMTCTAQEPV